MEVLIGVDEAGYGPNYGPLCIAATAWRIHPRSGVSPPPASPACAAPIPPLPDLYKLLRKIVSRTPTKTGRKLAIADSKALYSSGSGLEQLERGVLAALASIDALPGGRATSGCVEQVAELLAATTADPHHRRRDLACHVNDDQGLPLDAIAEDICRMANKLRSSCEESGVALLAIRARLVYPGEFNELVDQFGSKGAALSHVTLALVRGLVDETLEDGTDVADSSSPVPNPHYSICLDKHGGRNQYAALLQHHFPESWIEPISEARSLSRYRWRHASAAIEAVFRVGCEELLPTALASMTAKYHREVAMRAFNSFWTSRLPELRPTAGYPRDARRFREDIASLQATLGIDDRQLWRCR